MDRIGAMDTGTTLFVDHACPERVTAPEQLPRRLKTSWRAAQQVMTHHPGNHRPTAESGGDQRARVDRCRPAC
jgi:hypothetical protein